MPVQSLVPSQLTYFVSVYRFRDYSKAASVIPMTRQGLIRSIQKLEQAVGGTLFQEIDQQLYPTERADALYELTMKWYVDVTELQQAFDAAGSATHSVTFADTSGAPGLLGIDYIDRFKESHPGITVDYLSLSDLKVDEALLNREVSMAITASPFNSLLKTSMLCEVDLCALLPADDPLTKQEAIQVADFNGRILAMVNEGCKVNAQVKDALSTAHAQPIKILAITEIFWLPEFVRHSGGIGIVASHIKDELRCDPDVACRPIKNLSRTFGISTLREHAITPEESILINYLEQSCSSRRRKTRGGVLVGCIKFGRTLFIAHARDQKCLYQNTRSIISIHFYQFINRQKLIVYLIALTIEPSRYANPLKVASTP